MHAKFKLARMCLVTIFFLALVLMAPMTPIAHAATITVQSNGDGVANPANCPGVGCRLRDAIAAAADGDAINFGANLAIVVTSELVIDKGLSINGIGRTVSVSGGNATRVFNIPAIGGSVLIKNISIIQGYAGLNDGAGIYNARNLAVENVTFSGNSAPDGKGGAIYNAATGTMQILSSTFANNSNPRGAGAGIYNDGTSIFISNSTFTGNGAGFQKGDAIWNNAGTMTIHFSTIASNTEGINNEGGTIVQARSIVANSTAGRNCDGTITDGGYNLQFGGSVADSCGATIQIANPLLGALANNGGPTQTMAISAGSAALDRMPSTGNACAIGNAIYTSDQRSSPRPQPTNGACDIGAYELTQASVASSSTAPKEVPEGDTLLLLGGGLVGLGTWLRFQRSRRRGMNK